MTKKGYSVYLEKIIQRALEKQRNSFWLGVQARGKNDKPPSKDGVSAGLVGVSPPPPAGLTGEL